MIIMIINNIIHDGPPTSSRTIRNALCTFAGSPTIRAAVHSGADEAAAEDDEEEDSSSADDDGAALSSTADSFKGFDSAVVTTVVAAVAAAVTAVLPPPPPVAVVFVAVALVLVDGHTIDGGRMLMETRLSD